MAAAISRGNGRPGETISAAYIWGLRTGVKDNPTMRHLQALARFFQVSPAYFFEEELTDLPEPDVRLLAASRRETLRRLALTLLAGRRGLGHLALLRRPAALRRGLPRHAGSARGPRRPGCVETGDRVPGAIAALPCVP